MSAQKTDTLAELRSAIDSVDDKLVALFAKRFALVKRVVRVKKVFGLPAAIPERIAEVVTRVRRQSTAQGFPPDTAEKLWRQLIADVIEFEEKHLKQTHG